MRPMAESGNGTGRLDRIERALELMIAGHEEFRQEHKQLLTSQVLLQDSLERLTVRVDKLADRVDKLTANVDKLTAHDEVQDRQIQAFSGRVDELVRAIAEWLKRSAT